MPLWSEIREQPEVLARLWQGGREQVERVVERLRRRELDLVYVVARGTSDNAGLYAKYALGIELGLPVALGMPSLFTLYRRPPRLERALVLGISQSGQSEDLCRSLETARRQGAATLVITNTPDSPLARESELVISVEAGIEQAVAATKSYTGELYAIALLVAAWSGNWGLWRDLEAVPRLAAETLERSLERVPALATEPFARMQHCVVLGRGYHYATAFEWALKLKELAYVVAEPYSSADFLHGPIALVEKGFPVLAVSARGPVEADVHRLLRHLREERQAEVLLLGDRPEPPVPGLRHFELPEAPEWVSPMLAILPAQVFTALITEARGLDPNHPRGLRKVTSTE